MNCTSALEGHLYDWENQLTLERQNLDILFFKNWLNQWWQKADVLEFGCGTGRISLPLAEAGHRVTGVDISKDRLDVARCLRAGHPGVTYQFGDMCSFENENTFDAILIPYSSFLLLQDETARLHCLHTIGRLLKPTGKAVIDISPNFLRHPPRKNYLDLEGYCHVLQAQITLHVDTEQDFVQQITRFHKKYHLQPKAGPSFSIDFHETWHTLKLDEMRWYLHQAGLNLETVLGTYEGHPLFKDSCYQVDSYKHIYIINKNP